MSVAAKFSWTPCDSGTELRLMFENAPVGLAQCQPQGAITALNPVLEQMLGDIPATGHSLSLGDLLDLEDQPAGERLLRELFEGKRDSFQLDSKSLAAKGQAIRWTAWRVSGVDGKQDYALALAQQVHEDPEAQRRLRQAQRLETVGRLAGSVVHDFNNLLTAVLLYCDLLLAGLEPGHASANMRRRSEAPACRRPAWYGSCWRSLALRVANRDCSRSMRSPRACGACWFG